MRTRHIGTRVLLIRNKRWRWGERSWAWRVWHVWCVHRRGRTAKLADLVTRPWFYSKRAAAAFVMLILIQSNPSGWSHGNETPPLLVAAPQNELFFRLTGLFLWSLLILHTKRSCMLASVCQLQLVYYKCLHCIDCWREMREDQRRGLEKKSPTTTTAEDNHLTMRKGPNRMRETQNEPRTNLRQNKRFI